MSELDFWSRFVLAVLATWRVTHLLANEDGPADLIVRFRARLGNRFLGKLMDCFYCLSLWIAAVMAFLVSSKLLDWLLTWLALSGAACLLERLGQEPVIIQPIMIRRDKHGMLWSEKSGDQEQPFASDNTGSRSANAESPTSFQCWRSTGSRTHGGIFFRKSSLLGKFADGRARTGDRPAIPIFRRAPRPICRCTRCEGIIADAILSPDLGMTLHKTDKNIIFKNNVPSRRGSKNSVC